MLSFLRFSVIVYLFLKKKKEGTKFLSGKVLPSLDASNLVNLHLTESTFCISRGQKYLSLCWFKNLT